ncbi:hypothetical protein [Thalassobacillus sp. C254]|uniref:hypothetical protein n=1 Tax=Thalassobacillus sp. C254 TaxID=1225341 RepID=UPI0006D00365|nr:hypothetical protein [Thalassobacillus sp. C254]
MLFNIMIGFLFPWVMGLILYKKDKQVITRAVPFVSVISLIINILGNRYWVVKPKISSRKLQFLTTMPHNFGYFPILGALMIYWRKKRVFSEKADLFLCTLLSTFFELIAVAAGRVEYRNGWNIYKTFLSYLFPAYLLYKFNCWRERSTISSMNM